MTSQENGAGDIVTVSMRRPSSYYSATLYAKFRSNEILTVQACDTAIGVAAEIIQSIQRNGDAEICTFETHYAKDNFRSASIHVMLKRTAQLTKKNELA